MSGPTDPTRDADPGHEPDRRALARSFDATAAAYELGRPEYPDEALTFWDDHGAFEHGNIVLDLAASTGKLTRLLPSAFGPVETFECRWQHATTIDGVLADVLSRSYVSALPSAEHLGVLTRTREAIERHLGSGVEAISYPYRTTAFWSSLSPPGVA